MKEKIQQQLRNIRATEQELALAHQRRPCAESLDDLLAIQARITDLERELQAHSD
jgi:hypothetical protein